MIICSYGQGYSSSSLKNSKWTQVWELHTEYAVLQVKSRD